MIYIGFNFHLLLFPDPKPHGNLRVSRLNTSQMAKDLMNLDLWWFLHRSLNIPSYSCYFNELKSIQATICIHTSSWLTWKMQQPDQGPLSLPFAPLAPSWDSEAYAFPIACFDFSSCNRFVYKFSGMSAHWLWRKVCPLPLPLVRSFSSKLLFQDWDTELEEAASLCASLLSVYIFYCILFRAVSLLKKLCSQSQKDTFW